MREIFKNLNIEFMQTIKKNFLRCPIYDAMKQSVCI